MNIAKAISLVATNLALLLINIKIGKSVQGQEVTMLDANAVRIQLSNQEKVNLYYTLELQHFIARLLSAEV